MERENDINGDFREKEEREKEKKIMNPDGDSSRKKREGLFWMMIG